MPREVLNFSRFDSRLKPVTWAPGPTTHKLSAAMLLVQGEKRLECRSAQRHAASPASLVERNRKHALFKVNVIPPRVILLATPQTGVD